MGQPGRVQLCYRRLGLPVLAFDIAETLGCRIVIGLFTVLDICYLGLDVSIDKPSSLLLFDTAKP